MKKKFLSAILSTGILISMFSMTAFAGSASNNVGNYRLFASCTTAYSEHTITALEGAVYPTGSATVKYTVNGQTKTAYPAGTSSSSYWQTGKYYAPGSIYSAKTSGHGGSVTAYP